MASISEGYRFLAQVVRRLGMPNRCRWVLLYACLNGATFFVAKAQILSKIRPITASGYDYNWAVAKDSKSNFYLSFSLSSKAMDSVNINNELFYDSLPKRHFLIKLDDKRNIKWIKKSPESIYNISVLSNDDIIICDSEREFFRISRLSPDGRLIWEVKERSSPHTRVYKMIVDHADNIYITGDAHEWKWFGRQINDKGCCSDHDFLAKFSPSGTLTWIIASLPGETTIGKDLAFDSEGNILLLGQFWRYMNLEGHHLTNNTGNQNSYLASVSPSGSVRWLRAFEGSKGHCYLTNLEVSETGNMFFGGTFSGTIQIQDTTFTSDGDSDIVYGSLNSVGDLLWSRQIGSEGTQVFTDLILSNGNLLLSAQTNTDLQIDDKKIFAEGGRSFIFKSTQLGELQWIKDIAYCTVDRFAVDHPLNSNNLITDIGQSRYLIYGNFVKEIVDVNRSYSSRLHDLFTAVLSETCPDNQPIIASSSDIKLTLCQNESTEVQLTPRHHSDSYELNLAHGKLQFDLQNDILNVTKLLSDTAVIRLHLENCISEDFQTITLLKRTPEPPVVASGLRWCESNLSNAQVTMLGENIRWYASDSTEKPIALGNTYPVLKDDILFATQTVEGCESRPTRVVIQVDEPPQPPVAKNYYKTCAGAGLLVKQTSEQFNWYDSEMNFLQSSGELSFISTNPGVYKYYLTSIAGFCESLPLMIQIEVADYYEPPTLENYYQACVGSKLLIKQASKKFNWYDSKNNFIHSSDSFSFVGTEPGLYNYYLTSTKDKCESRPLLVQIEVVEYNESDVFITNVVTPNGDEKNDYFFLQSFQSEVCAGRFREIQIFNRSGRKVYHSTDRYFKWQPKEDASGIYFFHMKFAHVSFKGTISVLR